MTVEAAGTNSRAWYQNSIAEFLSADVDTVLARLTENSGFDITRDQRDAWLFTIASLRQHLVSLSGSVFLEFSIPRMGSRVDAIVLTGPVVFVIEYKVGAAEFTRADLNQAWGYGLDLKNFHEASHAPPIVPILVATNAAMPQQQGFILDHDQVCRPVCASEAGLRKTIDAALTAIQGSTLDGSSWAKSPYKPTPTIIEAARSLYAQHSVQAIARFDAGATNLRVTSQRIEEIVDESRRKGRKSICFVTGVPGAGKTLVGLNIANSHRDKNEATHAVFLSGNGPLVDVLREALTRDEVARSKALAQKASKKKVGQKVKAFIQNVHHFRDDALIDEGAPSEHVAIFDEAQRAWNLKQTAYFMRRKKNRPNFEQSEPEFLISCMNRHDDWAVVVCLVGGGQEIYRGEAGIGEWLEAINTSFNKWHVHISSNLTDTEYAAGTALAQVGGLRNVRLEKDLHLAVSMRSFRAEHVSAFVKALLDCKVAGARSSFKQISKRYPIVITRKLEIAKEWIRKQARANERYGLVASSKAMRLRPHALDIRVAINPVQWFLNGRDDIRSSDFLEDAATEFQVQGLELDWTCVAWDGDLRFAGAGWSFHDFRGSQWTKVSVPENQNYLRNAYRVLLTRARQGMVIFVPSGDDGDYSRPPSYYDPTFNYLASLGIPVLA